MGIVTVINLGTPQHVYAMVREEGPGPIPCDPCMGGMDAPWHIAFYLGDMRQALSKEAPIAYIICANCCVKINRMTDTCGDCIPDPTDDRVCDSCGKEYRRKKPATEVVEEAVPA